MYAMWADDSATEKVYGVWAITGIVPGFENRFSFFVGLVQMEAKSMDDCRISSK